MSWTLCSPRSGAFRAPDRAIALSRASSSTSIWVTDMSGPPVVRLASCGACAEICMPPTFLPRGASGLRVPLCAESWVMSVGSRRRTSSSQDSSASNTGATTRRASPFSRTAGSPPRRRRASSSIWRRSWGTGRCRPGGPASGTPAGRRTERPPTRTPTRIWTTRAGSPSSTTGSSRTSRPCAAS